MASSNGVKKTIIIVVAILLLGGGYYLYQKNQALAPILPSDNQNNTDSQQADQPKSEQMNQEVPSQATLKDSTTSPISNNGRYSGGEEEVLAPDIQVWQIDYDGTKFVPQTINIKVGDYVIFKNTGTTSFWPASDPHPDHTVYPAFDAGKAVAQGGKYQFQFSKVGSWGFHDHLNSGATGTVIVMRQ